MTRALLVLLGVALLLAAALWSLADPNAAPGVTTVAIEAPSPVAATSGATEGVAASITRIEAAVLPPIAGAEPVVRGRLLQDREPIAGAALLVMTHTTPTQEVARTTTGADGAFSFAATELVWLAANAPEVPRGWRKDWIRPSRVDVDLGDVHVPRGAVIEGVVRGDAQRPLAGASVSVVREGHRRGGAIDELDDTPVVADAQGRFRLDRVHPGDNRVHAFAKGYAAGHADVSVVEGKGAGVAIDLSRGGRVAGRVMNWRGEPLPGATVSSGGIEVTSDETGAFVLDPFGGGDVAIAAAGHDTHWLNGHRIDRAFEVRLDRLVPVRGVVKGHGGKRTTVRFEHDPVGEAPAMPGPYEIVDKDLPVAADGTFAVPGMRMANYVVRVTTHGVGASLPLRLQVRGDAPIELTLEIERQPTMVVSVHDELGQPILGAEAVLAPVASSPLAYVDGDPRLAAHVLATGGRTVVPFDGAMLALLRAYPQAFAVRAPGFLPAARAFTATQPPERVDVVLHRAGTVRGVVTGGNAVAYRRSVSLWRAEDDAKMRAMRREEQRGDRFAPSRCDVDAAGVFTCDGLAPGTYRAAVARIGRSSTSNRSDEQVDAVPIVDEHEDLRTVVEFTVVGGAETQIQIGEPPLGTLRGRVLLAGQPFAGALVVATRPGWRWGRGELPDFEDTLHLGFANGQRSDADGTFTFLYRDAGDVELRVRHPNGDATSPPTMLSLPPPGLPVVCELVMPSGGVRGRMPGAAFAERQRRLLDVELLSMHRALQRECARVDVTADGHFTFTFLPAGDWLVRVHEPNHSFSGSCGVDRHVGHVHWQRVVTVHDHVVELGEITLPPAVAATFAWQWPGPGDAPKDIDAVGLFQAHGAAALCVHRFALEEQQFTANVPPGAYVLTPVSWDERRGDGCPVRVAADGTVTPSLVVFPPAPR